MLQSNQQSGCCVPRSGRQGTTRPQTTTYSVCRYMYVRFGAFVSGIERFDSDAFRLPYAEAAALDPQARILLEQTHVRTRCDAILLNRA